ncbi:arabinogalactan endo-1,4-beta-galactosidase [Catalinimonas alkaloidigena]|uniref:Arabinogalactan endo-beta-1,4-galactanase n=1 Tax=Catalinimonas alkaloidigena TaxID=1075417 RepID=A0A1G9H037_9BACT|nr:glycosyl hydrolase 53 family protein [Catalinimonas alkaloidigena]SDL06286.1 arabinogalactan endo-1,4-beta-galactosidase [Catalinimonas alkaloidigena]
MHHLATFLLVVLTCLFGCTPPEAPTDPEDTLAVPTPDTTLPAVTFYQGVDLSYVNQILDHGGTYRDSGEVRSPYRIFKDHGANLARFRLWHQPTWTRDVYGSAGTQLYNDLADVTEAIRLAKAQGMAINLDFHYSDTWTDPGKNQVPAAWRDITSLDVLADSIYQYTYQTLQHLAQRGLMPEMVQIGNEINCGFYFTEAPAGLPKASVCQEPAHWQALGQLLNAGIRAVREVAKSTDVQPQILLHVADPKNITWWFDNVTTTGQVHDFDVLGFSFYPLWHSEGVQLENLGEHVARYKSKYHKQVMILETAYPWTTEGADSYSNIFGSGTPLAGYPFTKTGQAQLLREMTRQMRNGGGYGIIYWEPAWITSQMKDLWGTGSSWENATLFDFQGAPLPGMAYLKE